MQRLSRTYLMDDIIEWCIIQIALASRFLLLCPVSNHANYHRCQRKIQLYQHMALLNERHGQLIATELNLVSHPSPSSETRACLRISDSFAAPRQGGRRIGAGQSKKPRFFVFIYLFYFLKRGTLSSRGRVWASETNSSAKPQADFLVWFCVISIMWYILALSS